MSRWIRAIIDRVAKRAAPGADAQLGEGQATSRNFRSAWRMISLAEVWLAFARASMSAKRDFS